MNCPNCGQHIETQQERIAKIKTEKKSNAAKENGKKGGNPMKDLSIAFWNRTRSSAGQICGEFYPQIPGKAEGESGKCPKMTAFTDSSDRSWKIEYKSKSISGKGDLPSVVDAWGMIKHG